MKHRWCVFSISVIVTMTRVRKFVSIAKDFLLLKLSVQVDNGIGPILHFFLCGVTLCIGSEVFLYFAMSYKLKYTLQISWGAIFRSILQTNIFTSKIRKWHTNTFPVWLSIFLFDNWSIQVKDFELLTFIATIHMKRSFHSWVLYTSSTPIRYTSIHNNEFRS